MLMVHFVQMFYIPISVEVVKVFFPVGKFIILYSICFVICNLLIHSKIITVDLATLESIELYYVHISCVYIYTPTAYTQHSTHTCTRTDQRRKSTTKTFNSAAAQHLEILLGTFPETPVHRCTICGHV